MHAGAQPTLADDFSGVEDLWLIYSVWLTSSLRARPLTAAAPDNSDRCCAPCASR
jgi:hypothetical protein